MTANGNQREMPRHWLVVTPYLNLDGGAQVSRQLVTAARDHGQSVSLISFGWDQTLPHQRHGLWSAARRSWHAFRLLAVAFRTEPNAVVICIGDTAAVHAVVARALAGPQTVQIVAAQHQPRAFSDVVRHANRAPLFARAVLARGIAAAHRHADGFIFLTTAQRNEFVKQEADLRAPVAVIANAVRLTVCGLPSISARVRRMRDGSELRILHVGRISALKNQSLAVESLAAMSSSMARVTFVGEGSQDDLRVLAQRLGVLDRVRFLGSVSEIESVYDDYDIVLSTALNESFGLTPAEGVVRGLLAVVPNQVPHFRSLASDFRTVLSFNRYEPAVVAAKLQAAAELITSLSVTENELFDNALECADRYSSQRFFTSHRDFVEAMVDARL